MKVMLSGCFCKECNRTASLAGGILTGSFVWWYLDGFMKNRLAFSYEANTKRVSLKFTTMSWWPFSRRSSSFRVTGQ